MAAARPAVSSTSWVRTSKRPSRVSAQAGPRSPGRTRSWSHTGSRRSSSTAPGSVCSVAVNEGETSTVTPRAGARRSGWNRRSRASTFPSHAGPPGVPGTTRDVWPGDSPPTTRLPAPVRLTGMADDSQASARRRISAGQRLQSVALVVIPLPPVHPVQAREPGWPSPRDFAMEARPDPAPVGLPCAAAALLRGTSLALTALPRPDC
jgi:hypothetical protein